MIWFWACVSTVSKVPKGFQRYPIFYKVSREIETFNLQVPCWGRVKLRIKKARSGLLSDNRASLSYKVKLETS
jgi:hypothetical protein